MKKSNRFLFILIFCLSVYFASGQGNKLLLLASGLINPVDITNCGDSRLFVVEQRGRIIIVNSDGSLQAKPFLDITDRVVYGGERGLLGLAFHPDYQTNGYFYVNYIGAEDVTHIVRFKVSESDVNQADSTSETELLNLKQPFNNHNGGDLKFGPDGYLYIGLGDGGLGGDPGNRAQNRMLLFGKILRIDVNSGDPYAIPETNPFVNNESALPEIWAYGLRNPWKFSFDRLTGDLWIADVGQNAWEEIDFQKADSKGGENYGWRCYEGNHEYSIGGCDSEELYTFPVHEYAHGAECSVTGGYVYRGSPTSPFYGHYFFTDYCSDRIFTLHLENNNWVKQEFGQFSGNNFSAFGEDAQGQLYVAGVKSGKIFRIDDRTTNTQEVKQNENVKLTRISNANIFRIETEKTAGLETFVLVYDLKGRKRFQANSKSESFEADLSPLRSGTYIFNIVVNGKNHAQKVFLNKPK